MTYWRTGQQMRAPRECRLFSKKDKGRLLHRERDERGVASTVGTIMALLVFLTFLTLFTNSYVPVWMTDNERTHMNTVFNQFGDLKGKVDNMLVMAQVTGSTDMNMYAPITLGATGIPVFASPTAGQLNYMPLNQQNSTVQIKFNYDLDAGHTIHQAVDSQGGGMVELYAPNRYYVEQRIAYENGAILVKQNDGQLVRAFPSFTVNKIGTNVSLSFTEIDFIGKNASMAGTGITGLNIDLIYLDQQIYTNYSSWFNVNITFHTLYGKAWFNYLNEVLKDSRLVNITDYSIQSYGNQYSVIVLNLKTVSIFTCNKATVQITVQNA